MKRLLATTAIASMAFAGGASAQSLLEDILADIDVLTLSISNIADNLADIDASIAIDTSRDYAAIDGIIGTIGGFGSEDGFGSYAQTSATNFARDFEFPDLSFLAPLTSEFGDLATTAIGALQSGSMTVSFDTTSLLNDVSERTEGATTSAETMGQTFGSLDAGIALQNVSFNQADDINASITLTMADVNAKVGNVATTAIGALGSGDMVVDLVGSLVGRP